MKPFAAAVTAACLAMPQGAVFAQPNDVPLDIKGVALDTKEEDVLKAMPFLVCRTHKSNVTDRVCTGANTYGGAAARFFIGLVADKVRYISLTIRPDDFVKIADAMQERFGPPTATDTPTWSSRGGLSVTNTIHMWRRGITEMRIERLGARIDEGRVILTGTVVTPEFLDRQKQDVQNRAKDL